MDSLKWDVFWQWFCACVCVSVCVCVHKCIYLQSNACMNMRDHQYRYRFCSNCLVLPLQPETTPAMFLGLCWLLLSPHRDGFNRVAFREQINLILNMLLTTKNTKHWKKNTRPCLIKKKKKNPTQNKPVNSVNVMRLLFCKKYTWHNDLVPLQLAPVATVSPRNWRVYAHKQPVLMISWW